MRLTILGAGTCVPSVKRGCAAHWVEAGGARVRLDCGAGSVHSMAKHGVDWKRLTHQFISHFHLDHVGELPQLLFTLKYGQKEPRDEALKLIGPVGLEALFRDVNAAWEEKLLEQSFRIDFVELAPGEQTQLAPGVTLSVCKTPHTPESLAVRIDRGDKSLGYTGDTSPSEALQRFFAGVDVLVSECSFVEDARGTAHLTARDVAALANGAGAKHLVVTHFYFDPEAEALHERLSDLYRGRITVAEDGTSLAW